MNAEDIDNMPAGREMDALVAEKVIGWIWCAGPDTFKPGRPWRSWLSEPDTRLPTWDGLTGMPVDGLFDEESNVQHYSTDIAAAWLIVEKMQQQGHIHDFLWQFDAATPLEWCYLPAADFCLHVCRAALKALTAQEDK